ncbi:hypothetical protein HZU75_06485 [Chitinibacter fontanus]|uniref:RHS repeat-associated core domain-containing protein n=1 Tax=Chitinibacter fontanus TaxID=1737446 RepID=A0A7D5ZB08_9NEIS|nr:RHS repeat-associated core domain-containing protein [Chitinibacter fontanus]QLI81205.1 hypothetical protein HZU75_06485 [Chitinibacter fontanus]
MKKQRPGLGQNSIGRVGQISIGANTPWDHNWPYGPPSDAIEPDFSLMAILLPDDNSKEECGSIIECENQSLGESIAIAGTSLRLNYKSSRTPAAQTMGFTINLTGAVVPSSLHHIELEVRVAGRYFKQSFNPQPNAKYRFDWDGLDAYGRPVQGAQKAQIGLGYVYQAEYKTPAEFPQSFGAFGGSTLTKDSGRNEVTIWKNQIVLLGGLTSRMHGLGDWFVDAVNAYDPSANTLYFGDGSNQSGTSINSWQTTAIADIAKPSYWTDRIAINSSGDVLFVDQYSSLLNKVDGAGKITTIAGTGPKNIIQNGDRLTELGSSVGFAHIHIDGKNNLYFVSNNSIFRASPDGIVNKIAGNGSYKAPIDSVQALASSMEPMKIQTNQAGEVLFLDSSGLLCKINSDGILNVIAGGDQKGYSGDGGVLSNAGVGNIRSFALDAKDNIYIADAYRHVRKVTQDGVIKTIAGNGGKSTLPSDWGKPALAAGFWEMQDLSVDSFGNVFIADGSGYNVIKISQDGFLTKVPFGQHALWRLTLGRNGEIYAVDANDKKLYKMASIYPAFGVGDLIIPSRNGQEIYQFDGSGRQVKSLRSDGKTVLYQFEYTTNGYISKITDNYQNVVQIERDASEKASAIIAPNGQRTALVLDSNGHLASITNPASDTHSMTYSNDGLLKTFTNPRNKTSTMTYQDGLLVKDQNAIGGGWTLARTQLGERNFEVSMTSGLNRSTRYRTEYSATGDMIKSTIGPDGTTSVSTQKPDGTSQATNADGTLSTTATGPDPRFGMQAPIQTNLSVKLPSGLTMQQTQARSVVLANKADPLSLQSETNTSTINGKTFTSVFDAIQKRVSITSAANRITVTQLDAQGRPLSVQLAGILPLNYQYDARGRLAKVSQGVGDAERGVRYTYNATGEVDTITDAIGRITKYGYDLAGRVKNITQPDGRVVAFSYDANGNVTSVTPPTRPAHGFTFNDIDLASTYLPPELQAGQALNTQYEYNLDQQPTKVTRPDGKVIEYGYDEFGRLGALKSVDGNINYAYQVGTGQLASVTAGDVSHSYTYDGALPKTITIAGPVPGNVGITYDNFFRVQQLGINGQNTSYGYDNDGLLTQAGALTLNRDANNGLLTGTTLDNIKTEQEYDEFGLLKRLTAKLGSTVLFSETFTRDKLGRVEEKTTTTGGPLSTYRYAYDASGRLSDVFKNGALQNHYEYDANGNRTLADGIAASYDAQDRLKTFGTASYGFSANGELQSESTVAGNNTFSYDVYGNLKQVTLASGGQIDYLVDGQNRRIGKKVNGVLTQGWVYQDQLKPIAELDGNGHIVSRFIYAGKANVPEYMVKGVATYRLVTDTLGSVRQVVDSQTGQVMQELEYDAWGKVLADSNPGFQPFGYAGGLYDNNTGLVRFGARDYDAKTARWTAKDPILFNGGDSNIYAYVGGNPLSYVDPEGLAGENMMIRPPAPESRLPPNVVEHNRLNDPNGRLRSEWNEVLNSDPSGPIYGLPDRSESCVISCRDANYSCNNAPQGPFSMPVADGALGSQCTQTCRGGSYMTAGNGNLNLPTSKEPGPAKASLSQWRTLFKMR